MLGSFIPLISCLKLKKFDHSTKTSPSCTFCSVCAESGFDIVWEDETLIAFNDHKPAAEHHILIIPRSHISNVRDLKQSSVGLLRSMEEIGHRLLDNHAVPASMRRMGFHISPFHSVDHLHLHVHGLPYKYMRQAKYPIASGKSPRQKGLSWFAEIGQAIRILENGGRVGVFPC